MSKRDIILKFQEIVNQLENTLNEVRVKKRQIINVLNRYGAIISADELLEELNKFLLITTELYIEYIESEWNFNNSQQEFENKYNCFLKDFNSFSEEIYFIDRPCIESIAIKLEFLKDELFFYDKLEENKTDFSVLNSPSVNVDNSLYSGGNDCDSIYQARANTDSYFNVDGCYLTTACMKHYLNDFDDNCYELTVLRWFRDNFVSNDDIKHYYSVAPSIVESIEKEDKTDMIYDYIYDNIVEYCVNQIENGNYENAYLRYRESILDLERTYSKTKNDKIRKLKY